MSKLHQIPIVVVADHRPPGPSTSAILAILAEIEAKLEALENKGEDSTIDLRWLKDSEPDLELLRETLGIGEVLATVTTVGSSRVQETAIPCVWWITHRDYDDSLLGEFIEISEVPELLRSDRHSIQQGLAGLRVRSAQIESSLPTLPSL